VIKMEKSKENPIDYVRDIINKQEFIISDELIAQIKNILVEAEDLEFKSSKFIIDQINILSEENSLFISTKLDLSNKKNIYFIQGESSTGKTTIFDKISHFFLLGNKKKSAIKKEYTKLHLDCLNNKGNVLNIIYDSSKINEKFQIRIIKKKGELEYIKIENPNKYLVNNKIFGKLNCIHFIKEIRGDSLFKENFSIKQNLKPIFRLDWMNKIIDLINENKNQISLSLRKQCNKKEGLEDTITSIENDKKIKENHKQLLNFLIENEKQLIELYDKLEEAKRIHKLNDSKRKKIQTIKRKLKELRGDLRGLQDLKNKNLKSKIDIYIDQNKFKCNMCENFISHSILKGRIKDDFCWNCGIFEKKYDLELESLEIPEFDNLSEEINNLKKLIREKTKEIQEIEKEIPDINEIFKDYDKKIVKEIFFYGEKSELIDEINTAKKMIKKLDDELKGLNRVDSRYKRKKEECGFKITELQKSIEENEKFENTIKNFDNNSIEKNISEILKYANQFLINLFQNDKVGKLYYHPENDRLALRVSYKDEKSDKKIQRKIYWCYEKTTELAQGYNRIIDLALAFSMLRLNIVKNFTTFSNFLLIDGLETFNSRDILRFIKELQQLKDFKFLIFVSEIPDDLNSEIYEVKKLFINERITKDETLELTTQKNIFEFM